MSLMGRGLGGGGCTPTPLCWWVPDAPAWGWSGQRAVPRLGDGAEPFPGISGGVGGHLGGGGNAGPWVLAPTCTLPPAAGEGV